MLKSNNKTKTKKTKQKHAPIVIWNTKGKIHAPIYVWKANGKIHAPPYVWRTILTEKKKKELNKSKT